MMNHIAQLIADNEVLIFVVNVVIQATLVIVPALLLGSWLRRQPALRHSVLFGALICVLLCPVAAWLADRTGVSLISFRLPPNPTTRQQPVPPVSSSELAGNPRSSLRINPPASKSGAPSSTAQPKIPLGTPDLESASPPASFKTGSAQLVTESTTESAAVEAGASSSSLVTAPDVWKRIAAIAAFVWLAGIAVISIRLYLAWRYLSKLRTGAFPCDEVRLPGFDLVSEEVLRAVPAKRLPPLLVSRQLKGPISLGLFRPVIILPQEMLLTLNAAQLRDVLIHETAHIHRRDHVVVLMQRLAGAFFWAFPLVWKLNTKIDEAREDICDNYVLRRTKATQYSRMLLELTERTAPSRAIPLAIGLWQFPRKLEQRVTALLDPRRTTTTRLSRLTLATLAVTFMSIIVLLAGLQIIPASNVQAAESQLPTGEEKTNSSSTKGTQGSGTQQKQLDTAAPIRKENQRAPLMPVATYGDARFRYTGWISSLCFSPNGKLLASNSRWWGTALWDAQTGKLIRHFSSPEADYSAATFSPDGKLLVVVSSDVRVWNVATGKLLYRIKNAGQRGRHNVVQFTRDKNRLVQFTRDGRHFLAVNFRAVLFIETNSGKIVSKIPTGGEKTHLKGLALAPDGSRVIVATGRYAQRGGEEVVKTWDLKSGKEILPRLRHDHFSATLKSMRYSPEGESVVAITTKRSPDRFQLLDPQTFKVQRELKTRGRVWSYDYTPDGRLLAVGTYSLSNYYIDLFDPAQGRRIRRLRVGRKGRSGGGSGVILAISPDGKTIASAIQRRPEVTLWDAATGKEKFPREEVATTVKRMMILRGGQTLVTQDGDGRVIRRNLKTGRVTRDKAWTIPDSFESTGVSIRASELWKGSDWLRMVKEKKLKDSDLVADYAKLGDHRLYGAQISADGNRVAALYRATVINVYDRHSGKRLRQFGNLKDSVPGFGSVSGLALSPDGSRVVGYYDFTKLAGNVETGEKLKDEFFRGRFAPDGTLMTHDGDRVRFWDIDKGKRIAVMSDGHEMGKVVFTPDGKFMAHARYGENNDVVVWDIKTRKVIRVLRGVRGGTVALCFSPDGQKLVACDRSTRTLVWDLSND